ncbi:MAG: hypothetical protein LLG14_17945 [Nocardiaceae bacterium]|nr:hypothetical protein [Nocardiaceae bacterium]
MIRMVLAIAAIGILVLLLVVTGLALRHFMADARKSSRYKLNALFREEDMLRHDVIAHCYGFESGNGEQYRGNGALVLTTDKIWYSKMATDEMLEIPMSSIRDVQIEMDFRGELGEGRLLIVTFERNGQNDRVAFFTEAPYEWRIAILNLSQHPGT